MNQGSLGLAPRHPLSTRLRRTAPHARVLRWRYLRAVADRWFESFPCRVEIVDPETGEVRDEDFAPDPHASKRWAAAGRELEQMGSSVGVPCGPRLRFRRMGATPLPSRTPKVKDWERGKCEVQGVRALVGDTWQVFRWEDTNEITEKTHRFAGVLPSKRYSWKPVKAAFWSALGADASQWGHRRRKAFKAHAAEAINPVDTLYNRRALGAGLDDAVFDGMGGMTTRRALKAEELKEAHVHLYHADEEAAFGEEGQRLRRHIEHLEKPNLLTQFGTCAPNPDPWGYL